MQKNQIANKNHLSPSLGGKPNTISVQNRMQANIAVIINRFIKYFFIFYLFTILQLIPSILLMCYPQV
jgi:hypothetical protein